MVAGAHLGMRDGSNCTLWEENCKALGFLEILGNGIGMRRAHYGHQDLHVGPRQETADLNLDMITLYERQRYAF